MTLLTVIAEPFPDWEKAVQSAAARDLVQAIADTAPRGCSARYLMARGGAEPGFDSPLIRTEHLAFRAGILPVLWQRGATARPFDGEIVHAHTPLAPLRTRDEEDGSQTSVTVPHALAWQAPELMGKSLARTYRAYVKRATKLADVVLATTHATARVLCEQYGNALQVQVLPLAPPTEFVQAPDHVERRAALALPERYLLTTAMPGSHGRLGWAIDALAADDALPDLVVLAGLDPIEAAKPHAKAAANADAGAASGAAKPAGGGRAVQVADRVREAIPSEVADRVTVIAPDDLRDAGAALTGAELLLSPQSFCGSDYVTLGALAAGVPILHAGTDAIAELALDGGRAAASADEFADELRRLCGEPDERDRLSVLARDRGRGFDWHSTAWQLWETHANL